MAYLEVSGIKISGISACVPKKNISNRDYPYLSTEEVDKFIKSTGIENRRAAEPGICTSDLCYEAADKLLNDLKWDRNEVEILVFVTQTPDYVLPATSTILQDRLGLSQECMAYDISLGCSGYVYGMTTLLSSMYAGKIKKGLLLVGDTITQRTNKQDKSTELLFGDAGTATAFELTDELFETINIHLASDGSGYQAICIRDGGSRNLFTENSLVENEVEAGIKRRNIDLYLDGMDVFSFGIDKAPATARKLMEKTGESIGDIDYFVFHQANRFMNEKIRKKLDIPVEKYLYSLADFGNTSCATIPLTIVHNIKNQIQNEKVKMLLCGFGVGLSWGLYPST
ncbi:ketoacyl-ACP synthase III [Pedobacter sp. HDW13]|uniref:ketoacyl-ACP synthase III n=1 Tax=Pedobacter sp. HDW13 TaxID=2714940 RepID=UPI00198143D1|nr:ketoacyl-ACP synthase III [Pedobacter sp. HDW13]